MFISPDVMRFILGNSVSVATGNETQRHNEASIDFEETLAFDFSVPPPSSPEPVDSMSTGSLLASRVGITLQGLADASPFSESDTEPADRGSAGFRYAGSRGEFNEPLRSEFDDFLAPGDAHALSDWPL
jgi:hypothetical protein